MILPVAFIVALCVTLLIVRAQGRLAQLSNDNDLSGPQKFHIRAVPRIGGLGIFAGVLGGVAVEAWNQTGSSREMLLLLACSLPAFLAGLVEDFTKRVSPAWRMLFTAISAALALWALGALIDRIEVPVLDWLVMWPLGAAALTLFVVTGVTNSINIIDGFNGLASMCVMLMLLALAYVGMQVDDQLVAGLSLAAVGATLGFFLLNFPAGRIFLGDGGAYFLGFVVVELAVLLLQRNPRVSPMFPLLVCVYPIFETIFTMYRRRFVHKASTGRPDAMHLHHLVYKRLTLRTHDRDDPQALTRRNSMTSPYLWILTTASILPAVIFWDHTYVLLAFMGAFVVAYVSLYRRLAQFRTPRWILSITRLPPANGGAKILSDDGVRPRPGRRRRR
jgi:UDP-N-acetylmuramyl pentapeptide phosphotransferase/UDP-N-acetylglucosamine-1-phosphate transferase